MNSLSISGKNWILKKYNEEELSFIKENFSCPIAVYQVSGEYSMLKAAAEKGWLDEKKVIIEQLTAFKRSGASMIVSYHSIDIAKSL